MGRKAGGVNSRACQCGCGATFAVKPNEARSGRGKKYASPACRKNHRARLVECVCGEKFTAERNQIARGRGKFCSRECAARARATVEIRLCACGCGAKFLPAASAVSRGHGKYATRACYSRARTGAPVRCEQCGQIVRIGRRFCSRDCAVKVRESSTQVACGCGCGRVAVVQKHRTTKSGKFYYSMECAWADKRQVRTWRLETFTVSELAQVAGITKTSIYRRIKRRLDPVTGEKL